jgi:hypothetical protein
MRFSHGKLADNGFGIWQDDTLEKLRLILIQSKDYEFIGYDTKFNGSYKYVSASFYAI